MTAYGYFDEENREYVITDPRTPVKWINYIGALAFGGFVDHTGGAVICKGDPALNRITRYIAQLPASDFRGETLYIRTRYADSIRPDGYRLFSPFYTPCLRPYQSWECRVGLGYNRVRSRVDDLEVEVTIFVPPGGECEIRDIRVTNRGAQAVEVDAIPVVEYTHFDALKQFTNADWVPQTMQSRAYPEADGRLVLAQYAFMKRDTAVNYLTSNAPVSSFESDRPGFLGDHEYGTWADPLSLRSPELSNYEAQRGDNLGALLHHLGTLQPGETRRLITQLGQAESVQAAMPLIQKFRRPEAVDAALEDLGRFWEQYLGRFQVETPARSMDQMLNVHNPRQVYVTTTWSRYLSLYQLGFGARGIGFRDSAQDVMGVFSSAPELGEDLLCKLLQVQKRDGSAMHQFNPLTMIANEGDSREVEEAPKYYSDDHLWIVLAVCAYLKETGNLAFLEQVIPFYEKDKGGRLVESGTVREHLERAVRFTHDDTGAHGLPLLGFADWNDTVNLRRGAESLFTAHLYGRALLELMELAQTLGDLPAAERWRAWYAEMEQRVNEHAWDGEWYLRYFDWDGAPLGSQANAQGQIYLNGQSWAVLSGFATPEQARAAMEAVYARLNTPDGIKLSGPGFNGYDPTKGGITTYPPGAKENGGIFLHANPWAIIAEALLGNGDRAYQYYEQINPARRNEDIDRFEVEPYVYPQNILGDEHPQAGLGRNSWLTGTASWAYQAATQYILGVRPQYEGLLIDPCIPRAWDGFRVRRCFRGAWYEIEVENPEHVSRGVREITVDGQPISGPVLPVFPGGEHRVRVRIGRGE